MDPAIILNFLNTGSSIAVNATSALVNVLNIVFSFL